VHLFGELDGYLVTFTGRQSPNPSARPNELDSTAQRSWRWPEQKDEAAAYLIEQSEAGRDAYFGVHLFRQSGNRRAENAAEVLALWVDGDGAQVPEMWPQPTAVVESSPGRHHFYGMGGDKGKWGLGTVLRAPGTLNYKRKRPTLVAGGIGA
jgi:hypothetical protein